MVNRLFEIGARRARPVTSLIAETNSGVPGVSSVSDAKNPFHRG